MFILAADTERKIAKITSALGEVPRVRLAFLPTPLQKLEMLSEECGVEIFIKRDDLTGAEFGGNKTRKYEFVMGEMMQEGVDCLITGAAVQSNWCRQAAAASVRCAMREPVLYLFGDAPEKSEGNLLLDELLGAEIHLFPLGDGENLHDGLRRTRKHREERMEELEAAGISCRYIAPGAPFFTGHLGFVQAAVELASDLRDRGMQLDDIDYLATSVGTAGTYTGLLAGFRMAGAGTRVLGFSASESGDLAARKKEVLTGARETAGLLGIDCSIEETDVNITEDYVGQSYGVPTGRSTASLLDLARKEAVILDPVYTAKAMAGLIDSIESGRIPRGSRVVFWHTGGLPALFAEPHTAAGISRRARPPAGDACRTQEGPS